MERINKKKDKDKKIDSLNPKTIKGPQKKKHTNQYGRQDDKKE